MSDPTASNEGESDVRPPVFSDNPVCSGDGKTCGECGKIFSHPFYFSTHISIHASEKGFSMAGQCVACGLTFSDMNIFQKHLVSSQAKLNLQKQMEDDEASVTDNCPVEYDDAEQSCDDENDMDTLNKQLQDIKPQLDSELITVKKEPLDLPEISDEPKAKRRRQSVQRYEPEVITHTHPDNDPAVEAYLLSLSNMGLTVDPAAFGHPSRRSRGKKMMQSRGRWRGHRQPMERPIFNISEDIMVPKKPSPKYEYLDYDNILEDDMEVLPKSGKQTRGERLQQRLQRLSQQKDTPGAPDCKTESKDETKVEAKIESKDESEVEPSVESKAESKVESIAESKVEPKVENKVEVKAESTSISSSESNISVPLLSPSVSSDKNVEKVTKSRSRSHRTLHAATSSDRSYALDRVMMKAELEDKDYSPHSRKAKGRGGKGQRGHLRGSAVTAPRPVFPPTPTQPALPAPNIPGLMGYARANPNFRPPVIQNVRAPTPVNKINKQGAIANQLRMRTSAPHPSSTHPSAALRMPSVKGTQRVTKSASMVSDKGLDRFPKYLKVTSPKGIERAKQESRDYVEIMLQTLTDDLIPNKMNKNFANSKTFFGKPGDFLAGTSANTSNVKAAFPGPSGPRMISPGRGGMLSNPHNIRGQGRQASKSMFPTLPIGINSNLNNGGRLLGPSSVRGPRARGSSGAPASAIRGRGGQAFPRGRGGVLSQSEAYPVKMGRGAGTSDKPARPTPIQKPALKPVSKPVPKPVIITDEVIVLEDDDEEMAGKSQASSKESPVSSKRSTIVVDIDKIGQSNSSVQIIESITEKKGDCVDTSDDQNEKLCPPTSVDLEKLDKLNSKQDSTKGGTNPGSSADEELEVENIDGWKVCLAQNSDSESDEKSDKEDAISKNKVRDTKKIPEQSCQDKDASEKSDILSKEKTDGTDEDKKASEIYTPEGNDSENSASRSPPSSSSAVPLTFPTFIKDTDNLLDIFSEIEKTCKEIEENSGNEKEDSGNESESKESSSGSKQKFYPKSESFEDENSKDAISDKEAAVDCAGDNKIVEILKQLDGEQEKPLPESDALSSELTDSGENVQENHQLQNSVELENEPQPGQLKSVISEDKCDDEGIKPDHKADEGSGEVERMEVELTQPVPDTDNRSESKNSAPVAAVKVLFESSPPVETGGAAHVDPEGDSGTTQSKFEDDTGHERSTENLGSEDVSCQDAVSENEVLSKPSVKTAKGESDGLRQADDDEAMETCDGDITSGSYSATGGERTALESDQTEFGNSSVPVDEDVDMENTDDNEVESAEQNSHKYQQPPECVSSNDQLEMMDSSLPQSSPIPTKDKIENDLGVTEGEISAHTFTPNNCENNMISEGLDVMDNADRVSTSHIDTTPEMDPEINDAKTNSAGGYPELSQSDRQITSENATAASAEDGLATDVSVAGDENDDSCENSFKKRSPGRNSCKDDELATGHFDGHDDGDEDGSDCHGGSGTHINGVVGSINKSKEGTSASNVSGKSNNVSPSDCDSFRSCTFLWKYFKFTKRCISNIKCSANHLAKHQTRNPPVSLIDIRKRRIKMMSPLLHNELSNLLNLCHCHSTKTLSGSFSKLSSLLKIHMQRHPVVNKGQILKLSHKKSSNLNFKKRLLRRPSNPRFLKFLTGSYKQIEFQPTTHSLSHNPKFSVGSTCLKRKLQKYSSNEVCLTTEMHNNCETHQHYGKNPTANTSTIKKKMKRVSSSALVHFPCKTVIYNCSGHLLNKSKPSNNTLFCKYRQNTTAQIFPDVLNSKKLKGRFKNYKLAWNSTSNKERMNLGIYAYPPTLTYLSYPTSFKCVGTHGQQKQQYNYRQTQARDGSNSSKDRCNSSSFTSNSGDRSQRNDDNRDNGDENNKDNKNRDFYSVEENILKCRICGVKFELLEESQEHALKEHSGKSKIHLHCEMSNPKFFKHLKRTNFKESQQRFCAERTSSFNEYIETDHFSTNTYENVAMGQTQIVLVRPTKPVVKNSSDWLQHSFSNTRRARNVIECSSLSNLNLAKKDETVDVSSSQLVTAESSIFDLKQKVKSQISNKCSRLRNKSLTDCDPKLYSDATKSERDDKTVVSVRPQPDAVNDEGTNSPCAVVSSKGNFLGDDGDTVIAGGLSIKTEPLSDSEEESLPVTFDEAYLLKSNTSALNPPVEGQIASECRSLTNADCHSPNQAYQINRKVTPTIAVNANGMTDVHSLVLKSSTGHTLDNLQKVPEIVIVHPDKPVINLLPRKQPNRNRVYRHKKSDQLLPSFKDTPQMAEEVNHCSEQYERVQHSSSLPVKTTSTQEENLSTLLAEACTRQRPPSRIHTFSPREEALSAMHAEAKIRKSPHRKLDTFSHDEENISAGHDEAKNPHSPPLRIDTTFSQQEENMSSSQDETKHQHSPTLRIDTVFSMQQESMSASHCQANKSQNNPTLVYVYPKKPVINFSGKCTQADKSQNNPTLVYVYPKKPVINVAGKAPRSASVQVNLAPSLKRMLVKNL